MFKKLLSIIFIISSLEGYSQHLPSVKTLKKSDITAAVRRDLRVTQLRSAEITSRMFSKTAACTNYDGNCNALPLTLISFEGRRIYMETVKTNWQTTNEINTKGFDVQRSLGNTTDFIKIAFVESLPGNSNKKKYELNDNNSYEGVSYYRLKMLDKDDNFTYSNIVAVKGFSKAETFSLYPNPAVDHLNLNLIINKSSIATIRIIDAAGRILKQQKSQFNTGSNTSNLNIASLARGVYTLKVSRESETEMTGKFIKN